MTIKLNELRGGEEEDKEGKRKSEKRDNCFSNPLIDNLGNILSS